LIDTSALVAALLTQHQHHALARPHLPREGPIPGIVLAETYAQLRRTFGLTAQAATTALSYWAFEEPRIAALPAHGYAELFRVARGLELGGNVHDALIAKTCARFDLPLVTLDRRQHTMALALGVDSRYLLVA
jgi:predicted nucleic acid-binding protein